MSYGVGHRQSLDLALWCRLPAAALIWPLVWELTYASGAALKRPKKKKKKKNPKQQKKPNKKTLKYILHENIEHLGELNYKTTEIAALKLGFKVFSLVSESIWMGQTSDSYKPCVELALEGSKERFGFPL